MKRLKAIVTEEKGKLGSKHLVIGVVLLFVLIVVCVAGGMHTHQHKIYLRNCSKADAFYEVNNYREAIPLYKRALEYQNIDDVDTVIRLADCYIELNQYQPAALLLQDYYTKTDSPKLRQQADEVVDKLLKHEYNDHVERGNRYSSTEEYAKAIQEYKEAYDLMPDNEDALNLVIGAYLANSQIEQAKSLFAAVREKYDAGRMQQLEEQIGQAEILQQYEALMTQGEDYFCNLNYEECYSTYHQAIELIPDNLRAYGKLVDAYISQQEYEEAIKAIKQYEQTYHLKSLKNLEQYVKDEQEKETSLNTILQQLYQRIIDGDMKKVLNLLHTKKYMKWIEEGTTYNYNAEDHCMTPQIPGRKGLVIYGSGFIYCGSFENGKRSGTGKYLGLTQDALGYFLYTGKWADDFPNGEGALNIAMEVPYNKERHEFIVTVQGTYTDGMENGRMRRDFYQGDSYFGSLEYRCFFGVPQASTISINNFNYADGYTYVIGNFITVQGTEEYYYTNREGRWSVPGI